MNSHAVDAIILHPAVAASRERIAALRDNLHAVFNERLRLSFEVFPYLRDRYSELFGDLERALQERTLELSERRRMVELFSLKLDRGQRLDARTVELVMKAVRSEFARVRSRMLAAFSAEYRKDLDSSWRPSPFVEQGGPADAAQGACRRADELRALYRQLAKQLHPDARRAGEGARREYWDLVQRGYHRGDLSLLRTMLQLVDAVGEGEPAAAGDHEGEEQRLRLALRTERGRLEALKREEIHQMRECLQDEAWIASRRALLEADIASVEHEVATCDHFLAPILSGQKAPSPEVVKNIWSSFVEDVYLNHR
ncbi:MAG TPA: hypothetical protein VHI13_00170 [Candidatus Kapabacteria bacterium]|nr:hypothetical protein [Candidatus Kapabacteria bacterium]